MAATKEWLSPGREVWPLASPQSRPLGRDSKETTPPSPGSKTSTHLAKKLLFNTLNMFHMKEIGDAKL